MLLNATSNRWGSLRFCHQFWFEVEFIILLFFLFSSYFFKPVNLIFVVSKKFLESFACDWRSAVTSIFFIWRKLVAFVGAVIQIAVAISSILGRLPLLVCNSILCTLSYSIKCVKNHWSTFSFVLDYITLIHLWSKCAFFHFNYCFDVFVYFESFFVQRWLTQFFINCNIIWIVDRNVWVYLWLECAIFLFFFFFDWSKLL